MIVFRYTKTEGAEFISHLDTLRHLNKTFIRANIAVKTSQGFHPHMLVFMSSPIGVGLKSLAEYCTVDTDTSPEEFYTAFNAASPKGIKCVGAYYSEKNVNLASVITSAKYIIGGVNAFNAEEVLKAERFFVVNKRGEEKEVRDKIISVVPVENGIEAVLAAGNASLRPDVFASALKERYGGGHVKIIKTEAYIEGGKSVESLLKNG
ncbi:MAG: DUF2344 domain-containing protein [Clostridia bacterium]|nr:DUF2344 domain-containing protein [Clostridia bacterium]